MSELGKIYDQAIEGTYSSTELANELGVKSHWLNQLAHQDKIPSIMINKKRRFTEFSKRKIIEKIKSGELKPRYSDVKREIHQGK